MRHLPVIDVMRRAIRQRVCTRCFMRTRGCERLGLDVPRPCEAACTIFTNLIPLRKMAAAMAEQGDSPGLFELAMRQRICSRCSHAAASGGYYCPEPLAETCPLSIYGQRVIETLDRVRGVARA